MAVYSGQNYGKGDYGRIRAGVKAALIIEFIYSVVSAVAVSLLLGVTLGLFFSGDVDLTAMMPWARTYITICTLFYIPLSTIFDFPQYHAGLWLRIFAYDGRRGRAGGKNAGGNDRHESPQLCTFLLLRPGCMDQCRLVYRCILSFS